MATSLSNATVQSALHTAMQADVDNVMSEFSALMEHGSATQTPLSNDTTSFSSQQAANFISEQMIPLLTPLEQEALLNNGQLPVPKARRAALPDGSDGAPLDAPAEDPNATTNYLFSINSLQRVSAEMNRAAADNGRQPSRKSRKREEVRRYLNATKDQATPGDDEVAPMLEAIVAEMPQISIMLPGNVELRIAVNSDGKAHVMYVTPEGSFRTLPAGKTLRLNRWVNGITIRTDGTIALTP